jgi:hypothetical protein
MSLPPIPQESNVLILLELTLANFTFNVAEETACLLPLGRALYSIFQQKYASELQISRLCKRIYQNALKHIGQFSWEVPVNLAFRFCGLKKIPTGILRACTQIKAEVEPPLYLGS